LAGFGTTGFAVAACGAAAGFLSAGRAAAVLAGDTSRAVVSGGGSVTSSSAEFAGAFSG
jgi:hypothetical protein